MRAEADPTPPGASSAWPQASSPAAGDGGDQTPLADPLVRPVERPAGPSLAVTHPVRDPVGNSARTLLVLVLLLALGVAVWWWRRPADLTERLGDREWAIIAVDGEPATNVRGTVSTFVLDGTGEVRGVLDCNVASGDWSYASSGSRLDLTWAEQTTLACPADGVETYLPTGGDVSLDGGRLRVAGDVEVESIALSDLDAAPLDELAGSWRSGEHEVEIGSRGLFAVDGTCRGAWSALDPGDADVDGGTDEPVRIELRFDELQRDDCALDPVWRAESPIVPVLHDGSLYLRRDRSIFPIDRDIIRLDPVE